MREEQFRMLAIGDQVMRKNGEHRRFVMTGRVEADPNGTPIFHPVDAKTRSGYAGRALLFMPEEIEVAPVKSRE